MGFPEAVRTALFEKFATFSGRAPRSEYWWFQLFFILVSFVSAMLAVLLAGGLASFENGGEPPMMIFLLPGLVALVMLLPLISVSVRRLHDRGRSGWWFLAYCVLSGVPILGFIVSIGWLVFCCMRGTQGANKFGPDPLSPETDAEVFA